MERITGILKGLALIGFVILGFVQIGAIYSFFRDYWGWWFIFAGFGAMFISYIPLVGTIMGVIAAHNVWGWSLTGSILLFFWPYAIYLLAFPIGLVAVAAEEVKKAIDKKVS